LLLHLNERLILAFSGRHTLIQGKQMSTIGFAFNKSNEID